MKPMAVMADESEEGEAGVGLLSLVSSTGRQGSWAYAGTCAREVEPIPYASRHASKIQWIRPTVVCASMIGAAALMAAGAGAHRALESASMPSRVGLTAGLSAPPRLAGAHRIRSQQTGRCLDWSNLIVGSDVCKPSSREQQMWIWDESNHTIRIPDGRCLDGGGQNVHIWDCSRSGDIAENQLWQLQSSTGQIIHLKSQTCLVERPGKGTVAMERCDPVDAQQRWSVAGSAAPAVVPGQIVHAEGLCLDSGGKLHLWPCDSANRNQHWEHDAATGEIKNSQGHCLDAGSIGIPQPCRSSDLDQQWAVRSSDGQLVVRNYFCLGALHPKQKGSPLQLSPCLHAKGTQRWDASGMVIVTSGSRLPVGLLSFLLTSFGVLCVATAVFFIQRRCGGPAGRDRAPPSDAEGPKRPAVADEGSLGAAEAGPVDSRQEEAGPVDSRHEEVSF